MLQSTEGKMWVLTIIFYSIICTSNCSQISSICTYKLEFDLIEQAGARGWWERKVGRDLAFPSGQALCVDTLISAATRGPFNSLSRPLVFSFVWTYKMTRWTQNNDPPEVIQLSAWSSLAHHELSPPLLPH